MTRVAIVGYGFMGKTHCAAWRKCKGAKVVAVCDVNLAQLRATSKGNVPGVDQTSTLGPDVRVWQNVAEMLAAGGLDVVDITLPTPLHEEVVLQALAAGSHVLCEKPMALSLKACDRMLAAAEKAQRVFLVAQCVRFFPAYLKLAEIVRSGVYGQVIAADFARFMSIPAWSPKGACWLLDEAKSGGLYVDAHVHDSDFIASLWGLPARVTSRAAVDARGFTVHTSTTYDYGDNRIITSDCSYAASDALCFDASAKVFLEKATIYLGGKGETPLCVYPQGKKPFAPKLPAASGYEAEIAYFHDLVRGRRPKRELLTARDARLALQLVLAERKSAQTKRPVRLVGSGRFAV